MSNTIHGDRRQDLENIVRDDLNPNTENKLNDLINRLKSFTTIQALKKEDKIRSALLKELEKALNNNTTKNPNEQFQILLKDVTTVYNKAKQHSPFNFSVSTRFAEALARILIEFASEFASEFAKLPTVSSSPDCFLKPKKPATPVVADAPNAVPRNKF